ncbi:MAG: hypothetical protein JW699_03335 [Chitinispirillaceae bacterium]|nr:hypothetical protein [Chitinispirillaceae bacterium]
MAPEAPAITGEVQAPAPEASSADEQLAELKGKLDGLEESYLETKGTVGKLAKIKISGYLQAQMRYADTAATAAFKIGDFAGGELPVRSQSLYQVRRGRVKVAYETSTSQFVVQLDCVPKAVTIKDAYLKFKDPWVKSLALKMGTFDRPFGFEIMYSSSSRESPERSRLFQTLFPGERDLGLSLEFDASDKLPPALSYFNFKGGFFTGNGIADEVDNIRDFIGRFGMAIPFNSANAALDGGLSLYSGKVHSLNDTLYEMSGTSFASTLGNLDRKIDRSYMGGDLQFYYGNIPVVGGFTLRGEVISGKQPGTSGSNVSPKSATASTAPVYVRNFMGYYGMLVQNIDPLKTQLVVKYDKFDPNTDVEGTDVSSSANMMYSTLGLGLLYHWDSNVKFVAYYDMVKNEEITSGTYGADVTDNVFTFRIQYKF